MSRIPANASAVGAPETELDEIEVTPEMIEAGARSLEAFEPDYFEFKVIAECVYVAMVRAKHN